MIKENGRNLMIVNGNTEGLKGIIEELEGVYELEYPQTSFGVRSLSTLLLLYQA